MCEKIGKIFSNLRILGICLCFCHLPYIKDMIHLEGIDDNMIANNLTPFEATHPGDVIKDELEYRGISQRKLAETTGIAYSVLNEVLNGKRALTTDYALLIGKAIDIDAEFLIRMQADYDMQTAKRNPKLIMRLNNIRKIAAVF